MSDCDFNGEPHEWYQSGAIQYCYHCNAFNVPDPEDDD